MTKVSDNGALNELHELYQKDQAAKAILDNFASRTNNQRITSVDQVLKRLRGAGLSRWAVVALFRKLEGWKYGRFIEGRKGHPSRFVWLSNQIEVGKGAQGEAASITSIPIDDAGESNLEELRTYQFPLRAGTDATLELPADLTDKEAERLAMFIKTLAVTPG
jgi:hypothetical protein